MKLKKIAASILAAAIAFTAIPLTVSAEAEETEKMPLVTADLGEIHGATGIASVGRGVYFYFVDGGIKGAVRIFDEQLKSWKETGELNYTDISTDGLFTDDTVKYKYYSDDINFGYGDYMTLSSEDEDGNQLSRFAVRYDEKANMIVKVKDFEPKKNANDLPYGRTESITHKGYTLSRSENVENSTFTIQAFAPDGKEAFSNTYKGVFFTNKSTNETFCLYDLWINRYSDKYCCYFFAVTDNSDDRMRKYTVSAIDYNGETTELYSGILDVEAFRTFGAYPYFYDSDLLQVVFWNAHYSFYDYLYLDVKNDTVRSYVHDHSGDGMVKPNLEKLNIDADYCCFGGAVNWNKNVIAVRYRISDNNSRVYALVDIEKNEIISDVYSEIQASADNGETYLAKTFDGKYVYIDKNGKELGTFDKASRFCGGEYAPVIVDGKAYIINRDMEIVSEGIEAEEVWFLNKNVECIKQGEKYLLINVFSEKEEEEPPITEPETTAPDTEPETTAPEETPAPETTPAESDKSNTFTDNSSDKAADVQVIADESVIPSNAMFTVRLDKDSSTDTRYAYDLTFTVDGKEYQPNGTVTVKIPVPEELVDSADKLKVYHFTDENYINMNAKLENGYLVFTTDHFSTYVVTTEDLDPDKAPPTGVVMGIAPVAVLAALVAAVKKRK